MNLTEGTQIRYDKPSCTMSEDVVFDTFDVELEDGRLVHCQEAAAQEYSNCRITAGMANGIEPDSLYFRFEREGEEPTTVFLRPDEITALMSSCSAALWCLQMRALESEATDAGAGG